MKELEIRLQALEEAREHIAEAVSCIKDAVYGTEIEDQANAYIIAHLESWAEGNNRFDFTNIPNLINALEEEAQHA